MVVAPAPLSSMALALTPLASMVVALTPLVSMVVALSPLASMALALIPLSSRTRVPYMTPRVQSVGSLNPTRCCASKCQWGQPRRDEVV